MYVLFITMGYPTEKYPGNGVFEFDQAKALKALGHKVIYAFIDSRSIRRWRKWGFERKNIDGIDIYGINIPLGRVTKELFYKVSLLGLKYIYNKILKEEGKPDILHAHFTDYGYMAALLKEKVNIPLIITEHSSLINKQNINERLFEKALIAYNKADTLIAVSPSLAHRIEEKFYIKPIYVPNIVDTQIFNYSDVTDHHKFNFVSTGNLIYSKRMDLTIEAFKRAFFSNKNVTLTIFGDGPERLNLQKLIKDYQLEDRVTLKGVCTRKEIADKLRECDCFVLASQTETFGVAYVEALANGIPVIATKCGGPETFVDASNGLLVPVDDIRELTNSFIYMYNNNNSFNRKNISNSIKKKFSPESISRQLANIYRNNILVKRK